MTSSQPRRVLFMGSPEFALPSLKALLEDKAFDVVGVVSQPDRPAGRKMQLQPTAVKAYAETQGLKVWTPQTVNTIEFRKLIKSLDAEVGAVVAFGQILGQKFLDLFPHGCVNVHGSLLPRWRGAAPIQRALMAGDKIGGVSLQKVVKQLDAGDLISEIQIEIPTEWDAMDLHNQLSIDGAKLLASGLKKYLNNEVELKPQDESQVTYAAKIEKEEGDIQWQESAEVVFNRIRGLAMGPQASTQWRGKRLKILKTMFKASSDNSGKPGEVIAVEKDSFSVACGSGALEIFEVQPESKSRMTASEFLRGYGLKTQERLGKDSV